MNNEHEVMNNEHEVMNNEHEVEKNEKLEVYSSKAFEFQLLFVYLDEKGCLKWVYQSYQDYKI